MNRKIGFWAGLIAATTALVIWLAADDAPVVAWIGFPAILVLLAWGILENRETDERNEAWAARHDHAWSAARRSEAFIDFHLLRTDEAASIVRETSGDGFRVFEFTGNVGSDTRAGNVCLLETPMPAECTVVSKYLPRAWSELRDESQPEKEFGDAAFRKHHRVFGDPSVLPADLDSAIEKFVEFGIEIRTHGICVVDRFGDSYADLLALARRLSA